MSDNTHICPWWLAYTFDNPLRKLIHKPERMFVDCVQPGMTVADIGCGMGYFSLGLARMVGPSGRVLSIDMQAQMLAKTQARARKAGLSDIVETRLCDGVSLGLEEPLDFVLAFWMVHETPDQVEFFRQVKAALKPSGVLLVAEPKMHVTQEQLEATRAAAQSVGLVAAETPKIALSRSIIFSSQVV